MTLHREHRAVGHPAGTTLGSWCAWGAVALVALWSVWWILPRSSVEPTSMAVQVVLPLVVHVTAAAAIGWGLWRRYVPPTAGQLALLALGAAVAMESVALLLVVFPPVA
ncbi:hypothetical protein [Nocardioides marmoribigeumensis]|jgi:hypothetical protein|uniref:Uncharacterized protein n=1 Tax=Nocardioides marmoribigeumensis TaxID=433649 RepID=A0ABU2BRC5_9ACTN|nr:hypothetical protein [Nocardioides marmoribigeumensis]MDR7361193.1 hypothetical protein [Nocardioides marmoribigeumensis]